MFRRGLRGLRPRSDAPFFTFLSASIGIIVGGWFFFGLKEEAEKANKLRAPVLSIEEEGENKVNK